MERKILSFDVESVGLHGEGFAVGWVAVVGDNEVESGYDACPSAAAHGEPADRAWIAENVIPHLPGPTCDTPREVRSRFWAVWMRYREQGFSLLADCCWPVEARFLCACVDDAPAERGWHGPYPLLDVSSMLLQAGHDPTANYGRLPAEEPAHHPTTDARQSARIARLCMDGKL